MVLFEETQKFDQIWLWTVVAATAIVSVGYPIYIQDFFTALVTATIFGATIVLFDYTRLETTVEEDGIYIQFFPFHLSPRHISFDQVESFGAETYSPIGEFGGWGIRWIPFRNKVAYNVSGKEGVRITRENAKTVVIGSQKPEELEEAIEKGLERE